MATSYGYLHARQAHELGYAPAKVYLDGKLTDYVVAFNDLEGWADVYDTDKPGIPVMNEAGDGVKVKRMYGDIVYVPRGHVDPFSPLALTDDERRICSFSAVGASHETMCLIAIIERLTGEKIIPADER